MRFPAPDIGSGSWNKPRLEAGQIQEPAAARSDGAAAIAREERRYEAVRRAGRDQVRRDVAADFVRPERGEPEPPREPPEPRVHRARVHRKAVDPRKERPERHERDLVADLLEQVAERRVERQDAQPAPDPDGVASQPDVAAFHRRDLRQPRARRDEEPEEDAIGGRFARGALPERDAQGLRPVALAQELRNE